MLAKKRGSQGHGARVVPVTRAAASLAEGDAGKHVDAPVGEEAVPVDPTDAFLQIYMAMPWYTRLYYSAVATFGYGVWTAVVRAHGPRETKEKLKTYWTTLGVVSALLLGVSYSNALGAPPDVDPEDTLVLWAVRVVTVSGGLSLVLSIYIITFTVIYMIEIDNCTTDTDLDAFIKGNSQVFDILTGLFGTSVVLLLVTALGSMYINYPLPEFLIVMSIICTLAVIGSAYVGLICGLNRLKLYARYESEEARSAFRDPDDASFGDKQMPDDHDGDTRALTQ